MSSQEIIYLGSQLITKDFGLDSEELANISERSSLERKVEKVVQYLLDHDFQRLVNAMYRIDLSESDFKEILATAPPEEIAISLARAIIERELVKAELRRKYS